MVLVIIGCNSKNNNRGELEHFSKYLDQFEAFIVILNVDFFLNFCF